MLLCRRLTICEVILGKITQLLCLLHLYWTVIWKWCCCSICWFCFSCTLTQYKTSIQLLHKLKEQDITLYGAILPCVTNITSSHCISMKDATHHNSMLVFNWLFWRKQLFYYTVKLLVRKCFFALIGYRKLVQAVILSWLDNCNNKQYGSLSKKSTKATADHPKYHISSQAGRWNTSQKSMNFCISQLFLKGGL